MKYTEISPESALKYLVLNYWLFQVPAEEGIEPREIQHVAPADGCVSLLMVSNPRLPEPGLLVMGPSTKIIRSSVYPGTSYLGIRMFPGMAEAIIGVPPKEIRNQVIPLEHIAGIPTAASQLKNISLPPDYSRQIDSYIKKLIANKEPQPDQEVQAAVTKIMKTSGGVQLADIKREAAVSERQLQKRFMARVGLSMKEFAGICRFRAIVMDLLIHRRDLFDCLIDAGYYDQAHFLHHLKKLSGRRPEDFRQHVNSITHTNVEAYQKLVE